VNLWCEPKKPYGDSMVDECIVVMAKNILRLNVSSQLSSNEL